MMNILPLLLVVQIPCSLVAGYEQVHRPSKQVEIADSKPTHCRAWRHWPPGGIFSRSVWKKKITNFHQKNSNPQKSLMPNWFEFKFDWNLNLNWIELNLNEIELIFYLSDSKFVQCKNILLDRFAGRLDRFQAAASLPDKFLINQNSTLICQSDFLFTASLLSFSTFSFLLWAWVRGEDFEKNQILKKIFLYSTFVKYFCEIWMSILLMSI